MYDFEDFKNITCNLYMNIMEQTKQRVSANKDTNATLKDLNISPYGTWGSCSDAHHTISELTLEASSCEQIILHIHMGRKVCWSLGLKSR